MQDNNNNKKLPLRYFVAIKWPTHRPVAKFGQFIWNPLLSRLVWRDEIAETLGQLAELVNQAIPFVRDLRDPFLWIEIVPVPGSYATPKAENGVSEPTDVAGWRSLVKALEQANAEQAQVIARITGQDSDPDVTTPAQEIRSAMEKIAPDPEKIVGLPRTRAPKKTPRKSGRSASAKAATADSSTTGG